MPDMTPATYADFLKLTEQGTVIPVMKTIPADLHTPVSTYLKIQPRSPYSFLLESIDGEEKISRYSLVGSRPYLIARGHGAVTEMTTDSGTETQPVNLFEGLRKYMGRFIPVHIPDLPHFAGGAVGYMAYDAIHWFEPAVAAKAQDDTQMDEGVMMFFSSVLVFDHLLQQVKIVSNVFTEGKTSGLEEKYQQAVAEIEELESLMMMAPVTPRRRKRTEAPMLKSSVTKDQFQARVERAKEAIHTGDVFQLLLAQRFEFNIASHPFQIYRALRMVHPSPFMFFLNMNDVSMMGASHEMLLRCTGRRIDYRVVAGMRARGKTDVEDDLLGAELSSDEKEVAQHSMMVDVGRSDVGKVADYGSIEVTKLVNVERNTQAIQLVSNLKAVLRTGTDRFDALAGCFPMATMLGVPKIAAMKLIDELEPVRRGVFGGTVLHLDYSGNLDACVALRTIVVKGQRALVQAGTTIVHNSSPEREFVETVNQVRTLIKAIEIAEKEL